MGEAIISRVTQSPEQEVYSYNAVLQVTTFVGATVVCTNGKDKTYRKTSSGVVEFAVGYGTWTVTSTYEDKSRQKVVDVDALKVYYLNLKGLTFGVAIDCSVSDPTVACSYTDDAEGFTPLSCNTTTGVCDYGSWEEIITENFKVRPCLWNAGSVTAYLNKNNYTLTESGTSANITSGTDDVMVEFGKTWYKYSMSGNILKFQVADYDRSADGFVTDAFLSEDGNVSDVDAFYYGAYEGSLVNSALRSLSGKAPQVSTTFNNFRTYAKNRHTKCEIEGFYKRYYILGLLMLVTKSRDGQATIGHGRVNSNSSAINTGTMNGNGLFYGLGSDAAGCKVFGIENFWGNIWKFMGGLYTAGSSKLTVQKASPYGISGGTTLSNTFTSNYPTKYEPFMDGAVILPTLVQSDSTIGWPDYFGVRSSAGCVAGVGGDWNSALASSGPFYCYVYRSPSYAYSDFGARLSAS